MGKIDLKLFEKERDEAVLSFDVETFKKFYEKWTRLGFYCIALPRDQVIEITMRKMVLLMRDPPEDKLREARLWLLEHGHEDRIR